MSTPVKESIVANILTVVNSVTVAGGYNQTLRGVRPVRRTFEDVVPSNGLVVVRQLRAEKAEDSALGTQEWLLPVMLMAFVMDSDRETSPADTRINQVEADLHKALLLDETRGGNAIETTIEPSELFEQSGSDTGGIAVAAVVRYRTAINDPYTRM